MVFNLTVFNRCGRKIRKKLLFAFILINLLTGYSDAQTTFTPAQFSRLSVLTRARFFESEIQTAAEKEGVDPNILWTIAYNETRFRPYLTSPKNAQGLMQFIPSTAARYDLTDPYNSVSAIRAAARYVKYLSNLFGGRVDSILAGYNSGEGTVTAYLRGQMLRDGQKIINPLRLKTIGGVPPYPETVAYVGRGLKIYAWLIRCRTFPVNMARANFPPLVSATVARINVIDSELGKVTNFNSLPQIRASKSKQTAENKNAGFPPTVVQNSEQNSSAGAVTEIYYEARTGNRYRLINGNKTKLDEKGIVVIDNNNRLIPTNRARSTFFANQSNK